MAAMAVLIMFEFSPGCHGKTLRKMTVDDDLELAMAEEESRNADANVGDKELWALAERVADLVNKIQEVQE
jgi:hypothetical protein